MASEKKIFNFFPIISLMTPGARPIWTPGAWLADFVQETNKHRYILNLLCLGLMVSEKKSFEVSLAI